MRKYNYVLTKLSKRKDGNIYAVESVEKYSTGIGDPKRFILYKKLSNEDWGNTDFEYKLWKGMKYGDRLGFDTTKQIGESYAIIRNGSYRNEIFVYELYEEIED